MSIPKEPRQLLINLMYIVLTAMLALNVSAEVLHAFFSMDQSLSESNALADGSNRKLAEAIGKQADAYAQFEPYREKTARAQQIAQDFSNYLREMKAEIIAAAGGTGDDGMPVRKADKDIPTRLLVNEGRGEALRQKVLEARKQLLALVDEPSERRRLEANMPLKINAIPPGSDKKTWAQFTFQQMPVAAVLPILTKFQTDAKAAETAILNHFAGKLNITTVKPDQFAPVLSSEKSYVIKGEEFRGEIFLAAYSSTADNIAVAVDGHSLPVENGKAIFTAHPSDVGTKAHEMTIRLTNPLTGDEETFHKRFSYEVGERSVAVSLDKMNVFYRGVPNPISVSAAGVPSGKVKVQGEGVKLTDLGNGKFTVIPENVSKATITVSGGGLRPVTFGYRVKRIPDPVMVMSNLKSGTIDLARMKVEQGIYPLLEGFDFGDVCNVIEFEVVRLHKGDAATTINRGARFGSEVRRLIDTAQRGDVFYFDNVFVHCPGDDQDRKIPGLFFNLK